MVRNTLCCLAVIAAGTLTARPSIHSYAAPTRTTSVSRFRPRVALSRLPIAFEPNVGQADHATRFIARGPGYRLGVTDVGMSLWVGARRAAVAIGFVGAGAPGAAIEGRNRLPGVSNYLIGSDPRRWLTHIPTFGRVVYHRVYPGIDVAYHAAAGQLEYDFAIAPGADPARIHMRITGARAVHSDPAGDLVVAVSGGTLVQRRPTAYQEIAGRRMLVPCRYVLAHDMARLSLGHYDTHRPLIVDPTLGYSTYLGGAGDEQGNAIAVDRSGDAYVAGTTASDNLPLASAYQTRNHGGSDYEDAFVFKLNPAGTALVYSTYLGGADNDGANGIALDASGNVYVTGFTNSTDFPTVNAAQTKNNSGPIDNDSQAVFSDAFVAKLNASGSALVYSTYLGGGGDDVGTGIAVDASGAAYITGDTASTDFPTKNALQSKYGGSQDAFVAKVDPSGGSFPFSTYLGGNGKEDGNAIAVDADGAVYLAGSTGSTDFPKAHNLTTALGGDSDAYLVRLDPSGGSISYSDLIGGSDIDEANAIAVDASHNAYIAGYTASPNFAQSTTDGAAQERYGGGPRDAFVAKVSSSGATLIYNTLLGGTDDDIARALALDASGGAYVVGDTTGRGFPTSRDAFQSVYGGGDHDVFVTRVSPAGGAFTYSTYLGGGDNDYGYGVAVDLRGNVYITGSTASSDFPLKPGAVQPAYKGGDDDVFVTKIDMAAAPAVDGLLPNDAPASHAKGALYVASSHHSVAAPFVPMYRALGALLLGEPVDEAYTQDGVLRQDFDRRGLELHGKRVIVGNLGNLVSSLQKRYDRIVAAAMKGVPPVRSSSTVRYFPGMHHRVSGAILRFWRANNGMAAFGPPLSEQYREPNGDGTGRGYVMQYFEKARIELHPENGHGRYSVLLGSIGPLALRERGWAP